LLPVPVYYVAPLLASKMAILMHTKRELPYRNEYKWFLRPWKIGYTGTQRFAEEVLAEVERDSVIFGDGSTVFALHFIRDTKGLRPDVSIISWNRLANNNREYSSAEVEAYIRQRPFYVVSPLPGYCPDHLLQNYDFEKAGHLWKVKSPTPQGEGPLLQR
jgi:hypothetical protein